MSEDFDIREQERKARRQELALALATRGFPPSDIPRVAQAISDWVEGPNSKSMPSNGVIYVPVPSGNQPKAPRAKKKRAYTKKSAFWKKKR